MNFEEWCMSNSLLLFCLAITFFILFLIVFTLFSLFYLTRQLKEIKDNERDRNTSLIMSDSVQSRNSGYTSDTESISEIYEKPDNVKTKKQVLQVLSVNDEENINNGKLYPSIDKYEDAKPIKNKVRQNMLTPISIITDTSISKYPRKTKKIKRKLSELPKLNTVKKQTNYDVLKKVTEKKNIPQVKPIYPYQYSKNSDVNEDLTPKQDKERKIMLTPISAMTDNSFDPRNLKNRKRKLSESKLNALKKNMNQNQPKKIAETMIIPQTKPINPYQNDGENIELAKQIRRNSVDVESEF